MKVQLLDDVLGRTVAAASSDITGKMVEVGHARIEKSAGAVHTVPEERRTVCVELNVN